LSLRRYRAIGSRNGCGSASPGRADRRRSRASSSVMVVSRVIRLPETPTTITLPSTSSSRMLDFGPR